MADLPMAQIPNFQLGATVDPRAFGDNFRNVAGTTGEILNQGIQNMQRSGANQSEAQLRQAQIQQMQKEQEIAAQKQKQEQGHLIATNALQAYDAYGDKLGPESFEAFKKGMNLMAPGAIAPDATWHADMGDALKTASDAFTAAESGKRPWPEAIGVISKVIGQSGKMQREKLMPILGAAQDQFNQGEATNRQQSSQTQDTQRAYAEHAQPILSEGSALNVIDDSLGMKDPTQDVIVKAGLQKLIASGTISQQEIEELTKAGGPLSGVEKIWNNWTTGQTFDDTHRKAIREWIPRKIQELNNTLESSAGTFPGARPAYIPLTKKLKSGRTAVSVDNGKNWQYK